MAPPFQFPQLASPEWLQREYVGGGRTMGSLAREVGCSLGAIQKALRRHRIPSQRAGRAPPPRPKPPKVVFDPEVIAARYMSGESTAQIAAGYGLTRQAFRARLVGQGIPLGPRPVRFPQLRDPDWLRTAFVVDGRSMSSIAVEVGCSGPTVRLALAEHRIVR